MWNTNTKESNSDNLKIERNSQDNFYSLSAYNNNHQYCNYCGKHTRFEYDRCSICKNN